MRIIINQTEKGETMRFNTYKHEISEHYLVALIYGDCSGLEDKDEAAFNTWLDSLDYEEGHWSYDSEEWTGDNFATDEVTDLMANVVEVTYNEIVRDAQ